DVGCGTGRSLRFLRRHAFERMAAFDMIPVALATAGESGAAVHSVDFERPFVLDGAPWDALVAMDVIEHIGDDLGLLRSSAASLRPGGLLFLTAPAFPHLFSRWDERLHHFRRYTRRSLAKVVRA